MPKSRWSWLARFRSACGRTRDRSRQCREVRLSSGATIPFPGGTSVYRCRISVDFATTSKPIWCARSWRRTTVAAGRPTAFTDATAKTKLPKRPQCPEAWAVDIKPGDLDIVLSAKAGTPTVLRNNGDGTFLRSSLDRFSA